MPPHIWIFSSPPNFQTSPCIILSCPHIILSGKGQKFQNTPQNSNAPNKYWSPWFLLCPLTKTEFTPWLNLFQRGCYRGVSQLTVEKANKSDHLADYLDLTFIIDSGGKLSTRLHDKRDDFDFHTVNFPFLSSNIPPGPSYGVYISQLIRYARCCSHYDDFRYRHKCLVDRLLSQGYKALRLEKSFKKFYGRYQDLIEKYRRSVNAMVSDSFPGQFLFNM